MYIELFIADNFLMNYLLMVLTSRIVCANAEVKRLLLSAFVGCIYAVLTAALWPEFLGTLLFKLFISLVMCRIAFCYKELKGFLTQFFAMYIVAMVLAGGIFLTVYLLGGTIDFEYGILVSSNEFRYMLVGVLIASVLLANSKRAIKRINLHASFIHKVRIERKTQFIVVSAFMDTGNQIRGLFGEPVILVEKSLASPLMGNMDMEKEMRPLPYKTLSESGLLPAFMADEVSFLSDKKKPIKNVLIAVYDGKLCKNGSFGALMGPEILL